MNLVKCDNYQKIRLGKNNDGGYVIYDGLDYDLIIGCGINNDISFEDCFVEKYKCKSIVFDGTINKLPKSKYDHKWFNQNVYQGTLDNLLNDDINIFLKIDIEGGEWDLFKKINLENVSQMVIEFHIGFTGKRGKPRTNINLDKYFDIFLKIEESHNLIHIHPNNNKLRQHKYNDKIIHSVFEASYINKKLCDNVRPIKYKYDEKLDMPNNSKKCDIKNIII